MRKRTGTLIMLAGVVLAVVAGLLVLGMTQQTRAERIAKVEQVLVVMASRDIPDGTAVTADALAMQAFPADFVPAGAIADTELAVGKYATTRITTGQIVLANQLSSNKRVGDLSLSVPPGKVAIALPMSDLMSANGAIKAGDRVDVLLTLDLKELQLDGGAHLATGVLESSNVRNNVTQTTVQNVEVLAIGQGVDVETDENGTSATTLGNTASGRDQGAVILLLEPQDALIVKYAKDSGGVVDLALRAPEDTAPVTTDPVTIDRLFEQFNFQRPGLVP